MCVLLLPPIPLLLPPIPLFPLLLPPIPEGVIGIKPRGDTRKKQRTILFPFWAGPFVLQSVRRELFSTLKSSGSAYIFMKSRGCNML